MTFMYVDIVDIVDIVDMAERELKRCNASQHSTVSTSGPGTRLKCAACKVACL